METPKGHQDRISDRIVLKRLLAIVGISLLAISIIVLLCWLAMDGSTKKSDLSGCLLREKAKLPSLLSEMQQIKMASSDFSDLVSFSGFLRYTNEENVSEYVPLKLHNVTHNKWFNGDESLVLWTGCAKLTLNMATNTRQLVVGSIDVSTTQVGEHRRECQVTSTSIVLQDKTSQRYLCNKPASYECKSSLWNNRNTFVMKTEAILELNSLEFEVDSNDSNIIQTNQFSKKPFEC